MKNSEQKIWQAVVERFERHAPASVMARLALEKALPAQWIDEVFDEHRQRQRQYPRELLFSTVVELMTLVTLGLRPSLHAAARTMDRELPGCLWRCCTTRSSARSRRSCVRWCKAAPSAWRRWPARWMARRACRAGSCACSMATTCRPARSGWLRCAAIEVRRCLVIGCDRADVAEGAARAEGQAGGGVVGVGACGGAHGAGSKPPIAGWNLHGDA